MSNNVNCPALRHIDAADLCEESFAGLGSIGYIFLKEDLKAPLEHEKNIYKMGDDAFGENKGFYKISLKPGSQSITGESQKKNGGFKQTAQLVIEVVNEATSELLRALNNRDWALVLPDGDKFQIMYLHNSQKITLDSGALKTETGAAASDDRVCTLAPVLENCFYPNTWLQFTGTSVKSPEDALVAA